MYIISILVIFRLAVNFAIASGSIITAGNCITIMKDNLMMYERQSHEWYPGYLYMKVNNSEESDSQRWTLESAGVDSYRLRNKKSNKKMTVYHYLFYYYLKTADYSWSTMNDQFKIESKGDNKYNILAKGFGQATSRGEGSVWLTNPCDSQSFTIQNCTYK
jgi:hypothetical protein